VLQKIVKSEEGKRKYPARRCHVCATQTHTHTHKKKKKKERKEKKKKKEESNSVCL
jgi:hypothetical protein